MSKKKERASEVPSEEEIRELESMEIPRKVKEEVCQEVAEKMGISVEEVRIDGKGRVRYSRKKVQEVKLSNVKT